MWQSGAFRLLGYCWLRYIQFTGDRKSVTLGRLGVEPSGCMLAMMAGHVVASMLLPMRHILCGNSLVRSYHSR
jgi:hypothetical protein